MFILFNLCISRLYFASPDCLSVWEWDPAGTAVLFCMHSCLKQSWLWGIQLPEKQPAFSYKWFAQSVTTGSEHNHRHKQHKNNPDISGWTFYYNLCSSCHLYPLKLSANRMLRSWNRKVSSSSGILDASHLSFGAFISSDRPLLLCRGLFYWREKKVESK